MKRKARFYLSFSPSPAPRTHVAPHGLDRGPPQSRAPPQVHARGADRVEAGQDGEQVGGLVPEAQPTSDHQPDEDVDERRTPQEQEAHHHEDDDLQGLLLAISVRAGGLPVQLVPGHHVEFNGHDHLGEHDQLEEDDAEDVDLDGFGEGQQVPDQQVGEVVDPAEDVDADDELSADEAAVNERVTNREVPVELRKQKD